MVVIGDTLLPGTQITVESDTSFGVDIDSPGNAGLVGEADLGNGIEQGDANANQVYKITSGNEARRKFGDNSLLTQTVRDALQSGAYPVYALATDSISVAGEDLSGLSSTSGTFNNGPISSDPADVTFTIDGSVKSTIVTYEDPHTLSPDSGDVYYNPVSAKFELDAAPSDTDSTNDTVDYIHYDYATGYNSIISDNGEDLDFVVSCTENTDSVASLETEVNNAEQNFVFLNGVAGAGMNVDPANYSNPFDNSRMQLLYPTRADDGTSIIGGFAGLRAGLGIEGSVMKRRIPTVTSVRRTLQKAEKEDLDAAHVVPVENFSPGVRIRTDSTCVADSNTEEENMSDMLSRLIVDFVTEIAYDTSESYIGTLHNEDQRNALESQVSNKMSQLVEANAVIAYNVKVQEVDSYTASLDVSVETVKALRNVIADVTAGEVA